jgi:hypothetical protein
MCLLVIMPRVISAKDVEGNKKAGKSKLAQLERDSIFIELAAL